MKMNFWHHGQVHSERNYGELALQPAAAELAYVYWCPMDVLLIYGVFIVWLQHGIVRAVDDP